MHETLRAGAGAQAASEGGFGEPPAAAQLGDSDAPEGAGGGQTYSLLRELHARWRGRPAVPLGSGPSSRGAAMPARSPGVAVSPAQWPPRPPASGAPDELHAGELLSPALRMHYADPHGAAAAAREGMLPSPGGMMRHAGNGAHTGPAGSAMFARFPPQQLSHAQSPGAAGHPGDWVRYRPSTAAAMAAAAAATAAAAPPMPGPPMPSPPMGAGSAADAAEAAAAWAAHDARYGRSMFLAPHPPPPHPVPRFRSSASPLPATSRAALPGSLQASGGHKRPQEESEAHHTLKRSRLHAPVYLPPPPPLPPASLPPHHQPHHFHQLQQLQQHQLQHQQQQQLLQHQQQLQHEQQLQHQQQQLQQQQLHSQHHQADQAASAAPSSSSPRWQSDSWGAGEGLSAEVHLDPLRSTMRVGPVGSATHRPEPVSVLRSSSRSSDRASGTADGQAKKARSRPSSAMLDGLLPPSAAFGSSSTADMHTLRADLDAQLQQLKEQRRWLSGGEGGSGSPASGAIADLERRISVMQSLRGVLGATAEDGHAV